MRLTSAKGLEHLPRAPTEIDGAGLASLTQQPNAASRVKERWDCSEHTEMRITKPPRLKQRDQPQRRVWRNGRYWDRTSDNLLVRETVKLKAEIDKTFKSLARP